jgi:hypothetical protein
VERPGYVRGQWVQAAAVAVALLLFALGGSFAFDRDNDGIDDGGLSLLVEARVESPLLLSTGLILHPSSQTRVFVHYRFGFAPRSPPTAL